MPRITPLMLSATALRVASQICMGRYGDKMTGVARQEQSYRLQAALDNAQIVTNAEISQKRPHV